MGLRETKKLATRQQIAEVAMRLFVERGFDRVTVAEVAAEAGVSEKTVFNYFPTKEDLFFDEVPERARRIAEAIRSRPDGESIIATLRGLQVGEASRLLDRLSIESPEAASGVPGLVLGRNDPPARAQLAQDFIAALERHRHWERMQFQTAAG